MFKHLVCQIGNLTAGWRLYDWPPGSSIWCVYGTTPVVTIDHLCTTKIHYIFSMSHITSENWQQTIFKVELNWSILYVKQELYWHIWGKKYSCVYSVNNCFCKIVVICGYLAINHTDIYFSLLHLLLKSLSCIWLHALKCTLASLSLVHSNVVLNFHVLPMLWS
jgi:hypothetical protein